MAPLFLPQIRDGFGSIGDGVKGAAGKVADTGGDVVGKTADVAKTGAEGAGAVVDTSKDLVETAGKVKELMGTFEDLKAQMMEYYPTFLKWQARWNKYKWAFKLALVILGIMIVMCVLQCVLGYLKCFCNTCKGIQACATSCIWCGSALGKCGGCVFDKCGDAILGSHQCIIGEEAARLAAKRPEGGTFDAQYITNCGNPPGKKDRLKKTDGDTLNEKASLKESEDQRLGTWLSKHTCLYVPRYWKEPLTPEKKGERIQKKLEKYTNLYNNKKEGRGKEMLFVLGAGGVRSLAKLISSFPVRGGENEQQRLRDVKRGLQKALDAAQDTFDVKIKGKYRY